MKVALGEKRSFQDYLVPAGMQAVGYSALVLALEIKAPLKTPACVGQTNIRGTSRREGQWEVYDRRFAMGDTLSEHLSFALRYENLDLLVLKRIFERVPKAEMVRFIKEAPTGIQNRRAWFLYEFLTGETLDIPDAPSNVPYTDALDPERYFTTEGIMSRRHRVKNNLTGTAELCPIIRRTEPLTAFTELDLSQRVKETMGEVSTQLLARAASFLLLADSRASFEIEGERPPRNRLEHWIKAVKQAGKYPLTMDEITRLHNVLIADDRFIQAGLRQDGVFLGERDQHREPLPEFIGARPADLPSLMTGLINANERMKKGGLDPILQAAAVAFGFVYIHPLQDGNGRLHRYLIHHTLADRQFAPEGLVFPVSSVLLERIRDYRMTLQAHSGPLMDYIEWQPTADGNVRVLNDTSDLYRYYDCTAEAEFLYSCVRRTVEKDLPEELAYLKRHDEAMRGLMDSVDMPNRLAEDFILFTRQNGGELPKARRSKEFKMLTDKEVSTLQGIVRKAFAEEFRQKPAP